MKIIDKSFWKFLLVGALNTGVSFVLMFLLEKLGYWISTAIAYFVGAVISFVLNRRFTFKSDEILWKAIVKFAVNVALCYVLAYSLAQPCMKWVLGYTGISSVWKERMTKVFGMGLYTLINYFGQRFFAFNKKV